MSAVINRGMVLKISRGIYNHYAVYVGSGEVIHYSSYDSDISQDNSIIKTSIQHFIREEKSFIILKFPDKYKVSFQVMMRRSVLSGISIPSMLSGIDNDLKEKYNLYSNEDTARRAENRLGEKKYSVLSNNCEHFAIWCKTGIEISAQINGLIDGGIKSGQKVFINNFFLN